MDSLTVGIRSGRVVLYNPQAKAAVAFSWRAAIDAGRAMAWKARGLIGPEPERVGEVTIRRMEDHVLIEHVPRGTILAMMPLEAALDVGHALTGQARLIETREKAEATIYDQAILNRRGVPLGLTPEPWMAERAMHEAHWNSSLRRYLPGGVRTREAVGTPILLRHPTRRDGNGKVA